MRETNTKKKNKIQLIKQIGNMGFIVLLILLVGLVFTLLQSNRTGEEPSIAGYQMLMVLSGSMNPEFDAGSVVIVKEEDPSKLEIGDIITFTGDYGGDVNNITHRIVDINKEEGLSFVTKGDANDVVDQQPVTPENIIGKVHLSIPYMGHFINFVRTKTGLLALVIIPGSLIILLELKNLFKHAIEIDKKNEENKKMNNPKKNEETELETQ